VKQPSPTALFLHRARIIFTLTALVPTVFMAAIGIILLATGGSRSFAVVGGILMLVFCATALTGYTVGSIFVTRGASLALLQNEFLSSVSHELRTPLTSIRMFIDTLREGRVHDPGEQQRCLTVVHQELARLDGLVGRIIELSKIESRHAAFDRSPVRVADVVSDALAAFQAVEFSRSFPIEVKLQPGLMVVGDRAALAQVVGNLLGNAWKYTAPNDKRIQIGAEGDLKNVSISVSDNGIGIPRGEQEAIFEKFQRGSAVQDAGTPGTGLGLAIVRAVVTAHRGKVEVRSHVDRGSIFRIRLPRCRAEEA
jgi:two-component system phosphate regulon sensor histidine kinase PhoR